MKQPLIGLTCSLNETETRISAYRGYADALLSCGALPVVLPLTDDIPALLERFDGFVLTGGGDIDPRRYGQWQKPCCGAITPARDEMELALASALSERPDKPALGVCRGLQVMNVALGGDLYQDIAAERGAEVMRHRQSQPENCASHEVIVTMSSLLDEVVHAHSIEVNSLHHQAVRRLGAGFEPCGVASDGLIEAAALSGHPFYLGVQWHPERMWEKSDSDRAIFTAFVEACRAGR